MKKFKSPNSIFETITIRRNNPVWIIKLLTQIKATKSNGEARNIIKQGGIKCRAVKSINLSSPFYGFGMELEVDENLELGEGFYLIRKGRKLIELDVN